MKKILCITLSLILIFGTVPALAESGRSEELEKAILTAKNAVSIPQDYTEFYYSSWEEETEDGSTVITWNLEWGKEDGSAAVSAQVDSKGNLVSFYSYAEREQSGLGTVSREEGRKNAEAFLEKAMPSLAKDMRAVREKENAAQTYGLNYTYQLYKNGIPAPFVQAELRVNKYTGEVEEYNGLSAGQEIPQFPQADGVISQQEAALIYAEDPGAQLKYFPYFDYQKKTLTVFAGYEIQGSQYRVVDAITGDVLDLSELSSRSAKSFNGATAEDSASGGGDAGRLSPEEQQALDHVAGLMTKEKAESILRQTAGLKSSAALTGAYLGRDSREEDRYYWRLSFDGAYGVVDAKSGEVWSFHIYDIDEQGAIRFTADQARQKAQALVEKTAADKAKKCVLTDESSYPAVVYRETEETPSSFTFYFERQENGVGVSGDGLSVTIDARTGLATDYNCSWYETAQFPSLAQAMDKTKAFNIFNDYGKLSLCYAQTAGNQAKLVYAFENNVSGFYIDPFTGDRLGWNGKAYSDGLVPEYGDISGHWAEATIKSLKDNGYYLSGESFRPDETVTQEEFLRYLYSNSWREAEQEDFYKMLVRNKIVTAEEKAPDRAVTRQEAAKYIVRYLGFDKLAQKSEIFKEMFADKVQEGYQGYASICYGMDIMKGDEAGRFNGTAVMTRAEAACALYQLLQVK